MRRKQHNRKQNGKQEFLESDEIPENSSRNNNKHSNGFKGESKTSTYENKLKPTTNGRQSGKCMIYSSFFWNHQFPVATTRIWRFWVDRWQKDTQKLHARKLILKILLNLFQQIRSIQVKWLQDVYFLISDRLIKQLFHIFYRLFDNKIPENIRSKNHRTHFTTSQKSRFVANLEMAAKRCECYQQARNQGSHVCCEEASKLPCKYQPAAQTKRRRCHHSDW